MRMRQVSQLVRDSSVDGGFACGNAELPGSPKSIDRLLAEKLAKGGGVAQLSAPLPTRTARVAIETDYELYSIPWFNQNPTTIANYIGNLIGYDSAVVYIPQLNTSLQVSSISLWATANDPWTQTGSTLCGLMNVIQYALMPPSTAGIIALSTKASILTSVELMPCARAAISLSRTAFTRKPNRERSSSR